MSMYDRSYGEGYPEHIASAVYESPDFTEAVDLGPSQPITGGKGGFGAHHGVLLVFFFAVFMLFFLKYFFKTHNLG